MDLNALKRTRAELGERALAIMAKKTGENQLSQEDTMTLADLGEKLEALDGQIKEAEEARASKTKDGVAKAVKYLDGLKQGDKAVCSDVHEEVSHDPRRGYKTMAYFYQDAHRAARNDYTEKFKSATGMSQGVNTEGGFLLPPAYSTEILAKVLGASDSLMGRVRNIPTPAGFDSITLPAVGEKSRANGSRWGGIQGYWKGEATQMTSSLPKVREIRLEPNELYVFAYVTDRLLRNAATLNAFLGEAVGDEINFKVGNAIVNGTATGQPRGIMAGATDKPRVAVAKETGQAAKTIVSQNIVKMMSRMYAAGQSRAVWLYNVDCFPQFPFLTIPGGTSAVPAFLPAGGFSGSPFATLLGRPMIPCEYCATLGTAGDLILWDPLGYVMSTRGGIEEAMSIHLKFDYNETAFRWIFAIDGQPLLADSITPSAGTDTLSSAVVLAVRA